MVELVETTTTPVVEPVETMHPVVEPVETTQDDRRGVVSTGSTTGEGGSTTGGGGGSTTGAVHVGAAALPLARRVGDWRRGW
ncbi:hypothetical protein [Xylanimonas cellulosilytica]|uniref:hypothetical protein n=1 Tax=Xylanimonas cellulosilytica TaxID=186189 RepID=UPI000314CE54|nr:hypothetical protein [Xylanimonas cellulosilytica]